MALQSSFQERLQQMEETRNQRLSILEAEKELQNKKSALLAAKISEVGLLERRCLILQQRNAALDVQILTRKSEIENMEVDYQNAAQEFRALKIETNDLKELEKARGRFYEAKRLEMDEFEGEVQRSVLASRQQLQTMKETIKKLKSRFRELQSSHTDMNNSELAAAEKMKSELLATKDNLGRNLSSNYRIRSVLQQQLQNLLQSRTLVPEESKGSRLCPDKGQVEENRKPDC